MVGKEFDETSETTVEIEEKNDRLVVLSDETPIRPWQAVRNM